MQPKKQKRIRRHKRIRAKILGTAKAPRLCVFRSSKHIYAQLIDDEKGTILAAASDLELKKEKKIKKKKPSSTSALASASADKKTTEGKEEKTRTGKIAIAYEVGKSVAQKALKKKIEKVKFDRGGYKYHGRIKALAEGARSAGLKF